MDTKHPRQENLPLRKGVGLKRAVSEKRRGRSETRILYSTNLYQIYHRNGLVLEHSNGHVPEHSKLYIGAKFTMFVMKNDPREEPSH